MSNPFKETYFNTKTKKKSQKHGLALDPKDPMMRMLTSLYDFQQKWIAKEGALPEEVDARCVDMLGMRFSLFLGTMYEVHMRNMLFNQGSIDSPYAYLNEMHFDGKTYQISEQEHEGIVLCMDKFAEHGRRIPEFLDSLADFAI